MIDDTEFPLCVTSDPRLAEEWELVLLAQGLSPRMNRSRDGVVLSVPEGEISRARAALAAYELENPPKVAEEPVAFSDSFAASTLAGLLILAFFSVTVLTDAKMAWFERGSADAHKILDGELWRALTALTLHADVAHALSNAVALALFLGIVSSVLGTGVGCLGVLLAGAGGNIANALVHASPHVSIGASTAVFAAVGLLGGLGMRRTTVFRGRRAWLPAAAALALLGLLGTGGERVDVWAHLCGFLAGAVLGVFAATVALRRPASSIQWICGGWAFALLVYSWTLAFR
jgi:membrane associated rhomboid family serine protease